MTLIHGTGVEKIAPRYPGGVFSVTQISRSMSDTDPFAFVSKEVLERKGQIGTDVHEYAAKFLTVNGAEAHKLVYSEMEGYAAAVYEFLRTIDVIDPIFVEKRMLFEDKGVVLFGGTPDLLFRWGEHVILLDWKSRKLMKESDTRQLTGYDLLVTENRYPKPDAHWVIELKPNGLFKKHNVTVTDRSRVAFLLAATKLKEGERNE